MKLSYENIRKKFTYKIAEYNGVEHKSRSIGYHWHGNMEMLRVIEGCSDFTVNGKSYTAGEGDIIFVNVGEFHNIDYNHGKCKIGICTFSSSILHSIGGDIGVVSTHIKFDKIKELGIENEINECFDNLYIEIKNEEKYSNVLFQANLIKICGLLLRNFEKIKIDKGDLSKSISFQKILEYISQNYSDKITLESVSAEFNYNPVYISRLFNARVGVNFKYYLDNFRVRKATEMLLETDMTIAEISSACGYENIRTFNNVFKKVVGIPPSNIRKTEC